MQGKMKKWSGGVIIASLFTLLVLRYIIMENPLAQGTLRSPFSRNTSDPLQWLDIGSLPAVQNPQNGSQGVSATTLLSNLFTRRNLTDEEGKSLQTWNHLDHLVNHAEGLPYALEAVKEAAAAWESLMVSVADKKRDVCGNGSLYHKVKEKQCPYSISIMNASEFVGNSFNMKIPCGLVQGSSITVIGTPGSLPENFQIDLTATAPPGERDPPIILHYNVRLHGDKITENPVIVQNTWTSANDWGPEERCPLPEHASNKKVDDLEQCSAWVGRDGRQNFSSSRNPNVSRRFPLRKEDAKGRRYFPFKQGHVAVAILHVGVEGIQMTVDGKHVTSFAYRESLEPWLASEARISGDIQLMSVLAGGLPTSEDLENSAVEMLKSAHVPQHKAVDLFIGVFSTANNFKRRMAVRRTWMQYDAVRSGAIVVHFFVGLHKNQMVNEELWNEACTYGDIQLMPFVDYYSLITWKTIAICIYGTNVVSAKYVMKTDDDSFVRVDEVLASLRSLNVMRGLLYGRINFNDHPQRNVHNKWYISPEEWPDETYPPWAHGPGYVVSQDIAKRVYNQHKKGRLKMFKLEDVAMGIWIAEMKKEGVDVKYAKEGRVYNDGCENGYVVAHYQEPRDMLCLWEKLQETHQATCCSNR